MERGQEVDQGRSRSRTADGRLFETTLVRLAVGQ